MPWHSLSRLRLGCQAAFWSPLSEKQQQGCRFFFFLRARRKEQKKSSETFWSIHE